MNVENASATNGDGAPVENNNAQQTNDSSGCAAASTTNRKQPPVFEGKYSSIKAIAATQRISIQWTMFDNAKDMLGHYEEKLKKTEGYNRHEREKKTTTDTAGQPIVQPYIPNSLRNNKELLNCSKWIRTTDLVQSVYAEVESEFAAGKKLKEKYEADLAALSKNIAKLEIKARRVAIASIFYDTMYELAGAFAIRYKHDEDHTPETTTNNLAYAIVKAATGLMEEEFIDDLDMNTHIISNDVRSVNQILFEDFANYKRIKYDEQIMPQLKEHDENLISDCGKKLANTMPVLTTELWAYHAEKHYDIALDAELDEFLGKGKINKSNKKLEDAMETDAEETMDDVLNKKVNQKFKQHLAKEKRANRKNYSGDVNDEASTPTKNGRKGKNKSNQQQGKQRRSSSKRRANRYDESDDDSSYNSQERQRPRSRSRGRERNQRPRSILKKNLRWSDDEKSPRRRSRSHSKHRAGRGNGKGRDRGGRGGSRKEGRGGK